MNATVEPKTDYSSYPTIGKEATYIRRRKGEDGNPEIVSGVAIVLSHHMGPDKRPMIQMKEGDNVFNTEAALVNAPDGMLEKFTELCDRTDAATEAGNKAAMLEVEKANKAIEDDLTATLGPSVEF